MIAISCVKKNTTKASKKTTKFPNHQEFENFTNFIVIGKPSKELKESMQHR